MEVTATLRYLHMAPRKVRLAAGVIKGMEVRQAEQELSHRIKRASEPLIKLIRSAVANARHNFHIENTEMVIKDIRVNAGPVTKRFRARAFGRAAPIRRRTSHVIVVLETSGAASGTRRRTEPTVRDATAEDFRGGETRHRGGEKSGNAKMRKSVAPDFMRRVFQRKAI